MRPYLVLLALLSGVAAGVRVFVRLFYTDAQTGFAHGLPSLVPYLLAGAAVLLALGASRFCTRQAIFAYPRRPLLLGAGWLLSGLFALCQVFLSLSDYIQVARGQKQLEESLYLASGVLGLFSGLVLCWFGLMLLLGQGCRAGATYGLLLPVFWLVCRLVAQYLRYTLVTSIPDHAFELLYLAAGSLLYMQAARLFCGVPAPAAARRVALYGGLCFFFGVCYALPGLLCQAAGRPLAADQPVFELLCALSTALAALALAEGIRPAPGGGSRANLQ